MRLKIYGERNTGTNWLRGLLERNFEVDLFPGVAWDLPGAGITRASIADLVRREEMDSRLERVTFERVIDHLFAEAPFAAHLGWKHCAVPETVAPLLDSEGAVALVVVKHPLSWLSSLLRRPYHSFRTASSMTALLRQTWITVAREYAPPLLSGPTELWNLKVASYLRLRDSAGAARVQILRYEDLLADPERLQSSAETLGLARKAGAFDPCTRSTKDDDRRLDDFQRYYQGRAYLEAFDGDSLDRARAGLDATLVRELGYEL